MPTTQRARRRQRGEIGPLPSGALRARFHAGIDPVSGKRHYLAETVPAGPQAAADTERTREKAGRRGADRPSDRPRPRV